MRANKPADWLYSVQTRAWRDTERDGTVPTQRSCSAMPRHSYNNTSPLPSPLPAAAAAASSTTTVSCLGYCDSVTPMWKCGMTGVTWTLLKEICHWQCIWTMWPSYKNKWVTRVCRQVHRKFLSQQSTIIHVFTETQECKMKDRTAGRWDTESKENKLAPVQDWRSTLHNWRFCQVRSHVAQKLGQISKSQPEQI